MIVRPFYIRGSIDGRSTELKGGPRSKTGGAFFTILQRNKGNIDKAFTICQQSDGETLSTTIYDHDGLKVAEYKTKY